jgi:hypothetical protein
LRQEASREDKLLALLVVYIGIAVLLVSLRSEPFTYGLSTLLGTSLLTLTSSGSSAMTSNLFSGLDVTAMFSDALTDAQILVTVLCVSLLAWAEVANPTYGRTSGVLQELRRGWMPTLALILILFAVTVAAKVLLIVP